MTDADLELIIKATGMADLITETRALNAAMLQLVNQMNAGADSIDEVDQESKKAKKSVGGLGETFGNLKGLVAAAGLAFGASELFNLGKAAVQSAIDYETLNVQFEVFLGSADEAAKVLKTLNDFSLVTPFTPDQVNASGKALLAFGFAADQLIPTLKMVGDVSAASGKDFNELAVIYGKARTAGTLFAEDINQLTEAGIPIIDELASVFGVATDQIKKLGSEGKIKFSDLETAFANMTGEGGRFEGMMDKMSVSTAGLISTIQGKLADELRQIGQAMMPLVRVIVEGFEPAMASIKTTFSEIYSGVVPLFEAIGELGAALGLGGIEGNAFVKIVKVLGFVLKYPLLGPMRLVIGAVKLLVKGFTGYINFAKHMISKTFEIRDAFDLLLLPLKPVMAAYDFFFGKETVSKVDLLSQSIQAFSKKAAEDFGFSGEELQKFSLTVNQADFAGLSMAESYALLTKKMQAFKDATKAANDEAGKTGGTGTKGPLEGSIDALNAKLTELNKAFKATASATERSGLGRQIKRITAEIARLSGKGKKAADPSSIAGLTARLGLLKKGFAEATSGIERSGFVRQMEAIQFSLLGITQELEGLKTIDIFEALGIEQLTDSEKYVNGLREIFEASREFSNMEMGFQISDEAAEQFGVLQREILPLTEIYQNLADSIDPVNEKLSFMGEVIARLGEGPFEALKSGLAGIKDAFKDFAISAVESMGMAIGAGENVGEAFKSALGEMLKTIPKLAGMAMIQAAAAADPTVPFAMRFGLLAGGLALVGLSGVIGGIQGRRSAAREANLGEFSGNGAAGQRSQDVQGLGSAGGAPQPIIQNYMVIDGKVVAQSLYEPLQDEGRRRGR